MTAQERDLSRDHPEQVRRLEAILRRHMIERNVPHELFARLRVDGRGAGD